MKLSIRTIAAATIAAVGLTVGGIAVANGAVKPDCKNLMYPLCPRSVAAVQVVDNSIPATKIVPADRAKFLKDEVGEDVKGAVVLSKTFEPKVIEKIGGSFKTNKTKLGEFNLPVGKFKIDSNGFFITNAAGPAGTHPQLALRVGATETSFGDDKYGTMFPGDISPTANREITGSTTAVVTVTEPVTVEVFGFGYNDDTSAAGSGRIVATASVVVSNA